MPLVERRLSLAAAAPWAHSMWCAWAVQESCCQGSLGYLTCIALAGRGQGTFHAESAAQGACRQQRGIHRCLIHIRAACTIRLPSNPNALAVAATIATRNNQELRELFDASNSFDLSFFSNSTASQFLRHFLLKGTLQDVEVLQKRLRRLLGDATFLQAFMHSGESFSPVSVD